MAGLSRSTLAAPTAPCHPCGRSPAAASQARRSAPATSWPCRCRSSGCPFWPGCPWGSPCAWALKALHHHHPRCQRRHLRALWPSSPFSAGSAHTAMADQRWALVARHPRPSATSLETAGRPLLSRRSAPGSVTGRSSAAAPAEWCSRDVFSVWAVAMPSRSPPRAHARPTCTAR